jgi:DNA-binding MarR family transcriptional regulator
VTIAEPRALYLIKRLELAVRARLDAALSEFSLTTPQYTALSVLRANPGLSSAQLARLSFVTPQSMNEMVNALERRGLVKRTPDPASGRVLRSALTAAGSRLLRSCDAQVDVIEAEMFHALADSGRAEFRAALHACIEALTRP